MAKKPAILKSPPRTRLNPTRRVADVPLENSSGNPLVEIPGESTHEPPRTTQTTPSAKAAAAPRQTKRAYTRRTPAASNTLLSSTTASTSSTPSTIPALSVFTSPHFSFPSSSSSPASSSPSISVSLRFPQNVRAPRTPTRPPFRPSARTVPYMLPRRTPANRSLIDAPQPASTFGTESSFENPLLLPPNAVPGYLMSSVTFRAPPPGSIQPTPIDPSADPILTVAPLRITSSSPSFSPSSSNSNSSRNSAPTSLASIDQISHAINQNPALVKSISTLTRHGLSNTLPSLLDNLSELMARHSELISTQSEGKIPLWRPVTEELPFNLYSEACFFYYASSFWILSPGEQNTIVLQKLELKGKGRGRERKREKRENQEEEGEEEGGGKENDSEEEEAEWLSIIAGEEGRKKAPPHSPLQVKGKKIIPLAGSHSPVTVMFRRLPYTFLWKDKLMVGFDSGANEFVFQVIDLEAGTIAPFECQGRSPTLPSTISTEGVYFEGAFYLITSSTHLWKLDLESKTWAELSLWGVGPSKLTGSSNLWNGCVYVFGLLFDTVYELSLATLNWKVIHTSMTPNINTRDCHLMRLHGDSFVLLRMCDNAELYLLNMRTRIWEKRPTAGLRPGNFTTNPSYLIHEDGIYCLSGQSVNKHQLYVSPSSNSANSPGVSLQSIANRLASNSGRLPIAEVTVNQLNQRLNSGALFNASAVHLKPERKTEIRWLPLPVEKSRKEEREAVSQRAQRNLYADVTFMVGKEEFSAHRYQLNSSPYFAELFKSEEGRREFVIEGVKASHFAAILDSFYIKVELGAYGEELLELYLAADKFKASKLQVWIIRELDLAMGKSPARLLAAYERVAHLEGEDKGKPNYWLKKRIYERINERLPGMIHTPEFEAFCFRNLEFLPLIVENVTRSLNKN